MNYSDDPSQKHRRFSLSRGVIASVFIHFTLLCFTLIKIFIFPPTMEIYTPSLRVDVVDLPDIAKKDLDKIFAGTPKTQEEDTQKTPPKAEVAPETSEAKDEMVLNEKAKKKEQKKRTEKMNQAVARLKALEKLNQLKQDDEKEGVIIKGNRISKGAAPDGEEKAESEPRYEDLILERLRKNWELPPYILRQQLKAQVYIKIDNSGRVIKMVFKKSSGHQGFDDAVQRTITQSQPFPPPPKKDLMSMLTSDGILLGFPLL